MTKPTGRPVGRPPLPEDRRRKPIPFRFYPEELADLKAMADSEGRHMIDIMRDAIALYKKRSDRGKDAA